MVDLDTRLLRAFVAVAEELNFTRAAGRLHVAQQALSAQVQQLETLSGPGCSSGRRGRSA
jgi:DNA-binding transcriptional LysR family regulator